MTNEDKTKVVQQLSRRWADEARRRAREKQRNAARCPDCGGAMVPSEYVDRCPVCGTARVRKNGK